VNEGDGWQLYDMKEDPGEENNLAAEEEELTARLAADYEEWFRDVTRHGFVRFPIPVGHPEENPVALPATQAFFEGVAFKEGHGWANDWLTDWRTTDARITWELDVVEAGEFGVTVEYLCPEEEAGARVRVSAGDARVEGSVPGMVVRQVPSPDRVPRQEVYEMDWGRLALGSLTLPRGRVRLVLESVENETGRVMDVMAVWLDGQTGH
jgi:arylsulfatase A